MTTTPATPASPASSAAFAAPGNPVNAGDDVYVMVVSDDPQLHQLVVIALTARRT